MTEQPKRVVEHVIVDEFEGLKKQHRHQTLTIIGSILACTVALVTLHAQVLLPSILAEASKSARDTVDTHITEHTTHPHPGAVSREEITLIRQLFENHHEMVAQKIDALSEDVKEIRSEVMKK